MESLLKAKPIFSWFAKATERIPIGIGTKGTANLRKKGLAEKAWNGKRDKLQKICV
jgi:hypothetical protein